MSPLAAAFVLAVVLGPADRGMEVARTVEHTTCGEWIGDVTHHLWRAESNGKVRWVDPSAREWRLDELVEFHARGEGLAGVQRLKLGEGAVRVEIEFLPEAGSFHARIVPEPAGDFDVALAQYLPGVALPCEARGRISTSPAATPLPAARHAVRLHALERRATELLYGDHFEAAGAALMEAREIAPRSAELRWMQARVAYLEGEALAASDREQRLAAFARAERFADEAVALDPTSGEAWLWRAIARGRITTTKAALSRAIGLLRGERGPLWVAECFERAIELDPRYSRFGFTTAGDARIGAAQLYRLLPAGPWVKPLLGVSRDPDRAVALAREAVEIQPVRLEYAKELGVALLCRASQPGRQADQEEARTVLRAALALPVRTSYERTDHRHVRALLDTPPERACEYSRDNWDAPDTLAELP
jgi:tetratricopeptide (TPR) repeat protein